MAEQRCRFCGCTNERACPGGCSWVASDVCSACIPEAVASAFLEDCYWTAVDLGLIDGLAEDDESPPIELDTSGGWST